MAKRFRLIPFSLVPYFWFAPKEVRDKERLKHNWTDPDLSRKLLELEYPEERDKEKDEYKKKKLELDKKEGKVSGDQYEKESLTLNKEPYFKVLSGEYTTQKDGNGQMVFELDWNEYFVEELREQGWMGVTDDQVVNEWFDDACRQMIQEDIEGHQFVAPGKKFKREDLGDGETLVS